MLFFSGHRSEVCLHQGSMSSHCRRSYNSSTAQRCSADAECRIFFPRVGRASHRSTTIWSSMWVCVCVFFCFFNQPSSISGWTSAFLLAVHKLCGVIIEGRLSHFLPRWLRTGWQSAISQGKIFWNTPPWLGIEPGPRGGQTVSYPTELSWLTYVFTTIKTGDYT